MKNNWLPHLFYGSVLLAAGLFYADKISRAERVNRLLAEPISAAIAVVQDWNAGLILSMKKLRLAYRNEPMEQLWAKIETADSLTKTVLANPDLSAEMRCEQAFQFKNALLKLVENEPDADYVLDRMIERFDCRVGKMFKILDAGFRLDPTVSRQFDSLNYLMAEAHFLNFQARKSSDAGCDLGEWSPVCSLENPFPAVGDTLRADFIMSDLLHEQGMIKRVEIDGKPVKFADKKTRLNPTFSQPGLWPIRVRFQYLMPETDSLLSVEKTFRIRVKN